MGVRESALALALAIGFIVQFKAILRFAEEDVHRDTPFGVQIIHKLGIQISE